MTEIKCVEGLEIPEAFILGSAEHPDTGEASKMADWQAVAEGKLEGTASSAFNTLPSVAQVNGSEAHTKLCTTKVPTETEINAVN